MGAPYPTGRRPRGAPAQVRPGARHRRRRSGVDGRTIALVVLGALTVGVAGWYFVLGGGGEPSGDFVRAEQTYVKAAREIPVAATQVQQQTDLGGFDVVASASLVRMGKQLEVFRRLATDEEGESARIADDAAKSASLGMNSAVIFRNALTRNRVADANGALQQLDDAINDLEATAQRWKKL
jgi:hypothetical protein